ncbi:MAG: hypothetical protein U0174_22220 [Polyangiaceae bacterium]
MRTLTTLLSTCVLLSLPVGCASVDDPSADERGIEDVQGVDAEVTQELQGKPKYTLTSTVIRGHYTNDENCTGGFDACGDADVVREGSKTIVRFGSGDRYYADTWVSKGVILFSTKGRYEDYSGFCDDPGCGDILRISGVIYPVKKGNAWVPRIKATFGLEFLHPEEEDSPEGEISETVRMEKKR